MKNLLYILFLGLVFVSCKKDEGPDLPPVSEDRFLYSSNAEGHNELYKFEDNISSLILSDANYDFWWAKVSPDKSKFLVYRSPKNPDKDHDDYENSELMLYNIDGTNEKSLIQLSDYGWRAQGVCRWNEDGSKILMAADVQTDEGIQWRMFTTDAEGKNPVMLSDYWALDPNFSPDNSQVVFMGFRDNILDFDLTKLELLIGDYDAENDTIENITTLTDNSSRDYDPSFSPDGSTIVFSAGNAIYSDVDLTLWDVAAGVESKVLDDSAANGGSMCWSLDGERIIFHSLQLFVSSFKIKAYYVATGESETLLSGSNGFIHPEVF